MNKVKRILSMMLCICLVFSNIQIAHAEETEAAGQYRIYPIVRDIAYDGTEFYLDSEVNIVYEEGIDDATKAYLEDVVEENGMEAAFSDKAKAGKSNIILKVNGAAAAAVSEETNDPVTIVFDDVEEGKWFVPNVQYVYDNGLMAGSNGLFNPLKNVTRGQLVTTLYRLAGEPEVNDDSALEDFSDVSAGEYYTDPICWAYAEGIATGNNGKFDVSGNLTRQQMAAFFFRFAEVMEYDVEASEDYSHMLNADKVSDYAVKAVKWAVGSGLISGSEKVNPDGTKEYDLNPRGNTTRAQLAAILQRFCEANKDSSDEDLEEEIIVKKEDLFEQYDGYLLEAKEDRITIIGRDSDAVFRGVATLKMMLSSFEDHKLLGAHIEDYAGIEYRGFIEGFYGGWDYPTRADLMRLSRDVKMNMYVYASKTDLYHTDNWHLLYPEETLKEIEELVKIGEETKCYYVWSVHLKTFFRGLDISTNPDLYDQRYEQLVAKFTQLYDIGVRKFDILNDDFGSGSNEDVVSLLNRLNEEFIIPKGCEPITYCPQGYNKAWSGNGAELDALKALDDSILLYWTGDDVNTPITQSTIDYVANRTGQPVSFWLNYPVNEHGKSGVYLGNIDYYVRDGVTGLRAAVSNPSRFGYSNKVALFQLAALFWNNSNYLSHSEEIWTNSFNYLEPEVKDAYLTIARNVSNCPNSSRISAGFPESEYIKENLENVLAKVNAGEKIKGTEDATLLLDEFDNILNAVEEFKANCANEVLVSELTPWLKSLTDVATASKALINSVIALEDGDIAAAWSEFATASKAMQTWDSYQTCSDLTNSALAGSKRLQPFAAKLLNHLKGTLTPLLDSGYTDFIPTFYAKFGGEVKEHNAAADKIFDGDDTTFGQWNIVQEKDDYYGVDLGRVMKVTDIRILQGQNDTHHDYFHKAVLEYSEDGENFTQLGSQYNDTYLIEMDDLDIQARYVRLRLVEKGTASKPDYWTNIREFTVNEKAPEGDRIYTNAEAYAEQPLTITGKKYSVADLENVTLNADQYIGMKFMNLSSISSLVKEGTGLENLTLEVSDNGTVWSEVTDLTQEGIFKYVRLVNRTDAAVTFTLEELGAVVESAKADPKFLETNLTNGLQEGSWENVFDGELSTYAWTNEGQAVGDYIVFDLGSTISLHDVRIVTADGNPRLYNAEIQISADKTNWNTIATVVNDNSVFEVPYRYVDADANGANARYIRIHFTGATGYYLKLHEILFNQSVDLGAETSEIYASFGNDAESAIDKNLSTLFNGTATAEDYIEYKFTESTRYNEISILQDPSDISNAIVKIKTDDGYETLGKLDESAKTFEVDNTENIYSLRIEFDKETDISIYEIYLNTESVTDDLGVYVEPIIKTEESADPEGRPAAANLAPGKTITVSGTSDGDKDNVNDGDTSSKWDSDAIKTGQGTSAQDTGDSWIYIDLGSSKTSIIDATKISYFNKIYPASMEIQISNDGENWIMISDLSRDHNGTTHPVVTEEFEASYAARYMRLYFKELNNAAAGNGVGVTEWEVTGVALSNMSVKAVGTLEDKTAALNTSADALALPGFVTVTLTHASAGDYEVSVPVEWNTDNYVPGTAGTYALEGTLNLPETVENTEQLKAAVNVVVE